jgi:hypothetical protein
LPEDALEDLMIAEADSIVAQNPNVGMPGQLQGEVGVLDFEPAFADQAPIVRGVEGDGSDDEADIEVCGVEESSGNLPKSRIRFLQ